MRTRRAVVSLVLAGSLLGCATGGGAGPPVTADTTAQVTVDGTALVVTRPGGGEEAVATLDPERDGTPVHAAVRPGDHDAMTVLVLTRVDDLEGRRYELRYLTVDEDGATDLYWFPWRLQVDDRLAGTHDEVPVPVWAPDGSALAWVEWGPEGTRLRTVAWRDDDRSSNPSDDAVAYDLGDLPPGVQLRAWEQGTDGLPVLVGSDGRTTWRIRVDTREGGTTLADGVT